MTASTPVAVRCTDVTCTFGVGRTAVRAVRHATGVVPAGAAVAIVGPSGSGKSTLLHLMAGLEPPTSGTIQWPSLPESPLERTGLIGVVFQTPSLLPPLSVLENVGLPLLLGGLAPKRVVQRARAALATVGLDALTERLPEELSGGQAQRAAVARVLAQRPPLILADEPTGQLDSRHADQVMDQLLEVSRTLGAALVVATHDLRVADRISIRWDMQDGRLCPVQEAGSWL